MMRGSRRGKWGRKTREPLGGMSLGGGMEPGRKDLAGDRRRRPPAIGYPALLVGPVGAWSAYALGVATPPAWASSVSAMSSMAGRRSATMSVSSMLMFLKS